MPLWFALASIGLVALVAGSFRSCAAAAALLGNWIILTAYVRITGDQYNPLINGTVDLIAGVLILAIPFSRTQTLLAATYVYGLGWHGWWAQSDHDTWARYHYWYAMHDMAWAQLWLTVTWTGAEIAGLVKRGCYPWRALLVRGSLSHEMVRRNRKGEAWR